MTFGTMYDNAMVLWDKSGSPYMPQANFDVYANNKYNDFVEGMGKAVEMDERYTSDIMYLYKLFQKQNSNIIDRTVDVPDFRRRIRMNAAFMAPCSCTTTTTSSYTQPELGDQVTVSVADTDWMKVGEKIFIKGGGGIYTIIEIISATSVLLMYEGGGNTGTVGAPGSSVFFVKIPNVRIGTNATIDEMENDPLNKGIDEDPSSIATQLPSNNPGWKVYSQTIPLVLGMTYIKVPQVINTADAPGTNFEAPDYIANYIIRLVVYNMDFTIESFQRSKAEQADIAGVLS